MAQRKKGKLNIGQLLDKILEKNPVQLLDKILENPDHGEVREGKDMGLNITNPHSVDVFEVGKDDVLDSYEDVELVEVGNGWFRIDTGEQELTYIGFQAIIEGGE